jgi:ribosomal protein S6--L-glutamate ligase
MRSLAGVESALERVGGCPAIVKLQHGTQGIGTMLAESEASLHALLETLWAMGHEVLLQEYVREAGGSDIRAFVVGGQLVAAMRRTAKRGGFRSNLHRGARGETVTLPRRYQSCALKAASALGLEIAGVDILESKRGPVVVEVNSSPGLEGIEGTSAIDVATPIVLYAEARAKRPKSRGQRGGVAQPWC